MRINHNIAAMNSYRNFSNNTSKLNKNLEKLSTGLKINRAGDDAAGLAISEKMRAQISGITGAEKNAKDGISLIQTAEGALTEVHDMLNRMVTLAENSANGTYDNEVDRNQLQKEVEQLKTEIDRVADSTNYNGIKLLDGSMTTKAGADKVNTWFQDAGVATAVNVTSGTSYSQVITIADPSARVATGDTVSLSFTYQDRDNNAQVVDVSVKATDNTTAGITQQLGDELKKVFGNDYPVAIDTGAGTLTLSNAAGNVTEDTSIDKTSVKFKVNGDEIDNIASAADRVNQGKSDRYAIDMTTTDLTKKNSIEVDGVKYQIVGRDQTADSGNKGIYIDQTTGAITKDSVKQVVEQLNAYGVAAEVDQSVAAGTTISINKVNVIADKAQGGLTLQIGDTSASYNTLRVNINDMHSQAIGIGSVDVSTQDGASVALDNIKAAVNKVSDTRGNLGALQNRLDHTINNLGVMKENVTSAESLIRDTDVAEEMMTYTKNNILNQSAQAMLAQANQLPQGVLQLLG